MAESPPNGYKTVWGGKEKLLVTSNFSFSHSVFKRHDKTRACLGKVKVWGCYGKDWKVMVNLPH